METVATEIQFIGEALFGTHWIVGFQDLTTYPRSTIQSWHERNNLVVGAKPAIIKLVENSIKRFTDILNRQSYDSSKDENVAKIIGDALYHKRWRNQFFELFNSDKDAYSLSIYRSRTLVNGVANFNEVEIAIFSNEIKMRLEKLRLIKSCLTPSSDLILYRIHSFMQTDEFKNIATTLKPGQYYVIEPYFCFDKYQNKIYDAEIRIVSDREFGRAIELGSTAESIAFFADKAKTTYDEALLEAIANYKSDKSFDDFIVYNEDFINANKLAIENNPL